MNAKHWGLALLTFLFALPLQAQVASPPLDPSRPLLAPAAAGWKQSAVAHGSYYEGAGKRRQNGEDVYEFTSTGTAGGFTLPFWMLVVDAYSLAHKQNTNVVTRQEGALPLNLGENYMTVALAPEDSWGSIGLSSGQMQRVDYLSKRFPTEHVKRSYLSGSLSVEMGGWFYLGAGSRKVTQVSDSFADLKWSENTAGIGLLTGEPGESRFRLEVSTLNSPAVGEGALNNKLPAEQGAMKTNNVELEFLVSGLLFSGKSSKVNAEEGVSTAAYEASFTEGTVMWVPKEGLMLGFSFVNSKVIQDFEDTDNVFKVNTGFVF